MFDHDTLQLVERDIQAAVDRYLRNVNVRLFIDNDENEAHEVIIKDGEILVRLKSEDLYNPDAYIYGSIFNKRERCEEIPF